MAIRPRRVSNPFATRLVLALAPVTLACGSSSHGGNSTSAAKGGATAAGGMGGTGGGNQSGAGQGSGNAGATSGGRAASGGSGGASGGGAGGADVAGRSGSSGSGGSSGGGDAGRATGGGGASAGMGGVVAKAGSDDGGANDGGVAGCVLDGEPQLCDVAPDSYAATVIDFKRFSPEGKWSSDSANGITGRTSFYHSPSAPDATLEEQEGSLHVTVTLPPNSHAGWVFAFDRCSNGQNNFGLRYPLDGKLDGASLTFSLQINADYPIDVQAGKGACAFTSCDTIEAECRAPSYDIAAAGLPYSLLTVSFTDFTGGVPVSVPSSTDTYSIRGLQFELACAKSTPCAVDLTFGTLKYFTL